MKKPAKPTVAQRQAFQVEAEKRTGAILAKLEGLQGDIVQLLEDACELYGRDRSWGHYEPIRVAQAGDHRTFFLLYQLEMLRHEVLGQWPGMFGASAADALRLGLEADTLREVRGDPGHPQLCREERTDRERVGFRQATS